MGKRADPLAFWSARSMEPSIASHILMCSTRLLCLVDTRMRFFCIRVSHLSIMAITAETFRAMASSIANMASALATGSFRSRSPSWKDRIRASDELEMKKRTYT